MTDDRAPEEASATPEAASEITEGLVTELVRLRKKRKIAQQGIAEAMGTTQSRISQFENMKGGGMTLEAFVLYAQTIGVKVIMVPVRKKKKGQDTSGDSE